MRLLGINVEGFRNLGSLKLEFLTDRIFFIGSNGQGKSNLLEAIGFSSNLRSFRGAATGSMVEMNLGYARIYSRFLDDNGGEREVLIGFGTKGPKVVEIDGEPPRRLGEFLGQFPSVSLSSRDFRLVRESPSDRRKWMDLALSSSSARYLGALQKYHRAMKERNVLLKGSATDSQLQAFERSMADSALSIQTMRQGFFPELATEFEGSYAKLSDSREEVELRYSPDVALNTVEEWVSLYSDERSRDRHFGSTRRGPHRDDFELLVGEKDARHFASEGQQKGVVLALRLAEFFFLRKSLRKTPMLLADDVLGELDSARRANFHKILPADAQTFATGTQYPSVREKDSWETFQVSGGSFERSRSEADDR